MWATTSYDILNFISSLHQCVYIHVCITFFCRYQWPFCIRRTCHWYIYLRRTWIVTCRSEIWGWVEKQFKIISYSCWSGKELHIYSVLRIYFQILLVYNGTNHYVPALQQNKVAHVNGAVEEALQHIRAGSEILHTLQKSQQKSKEPIIPVDLLEQLNNSAKNVATYLEKNRKNYSLAEAFGPTRGTISFS